jgi:geranylgeranyl diphosphate synthase type II
MTVDSLTKLIEEEIERLEFPGEPSNLYDPIRYILDLGGKRMRPLLVLLGYSLFKDDPKTVVRPALSVELFHNFTLMHDDIMDNAPLRRGKPTIHEKWDNTVAILSGDTMFVKAYQLLEELEPIVLKQILTLFNQCSIEVCEGQQIDMDFESREQVTVEEYVNMIRLKTSVLLGFALRFGGIMGGADLDTQHKLYDLGCSLGLAFQLMDDHLDTFGDDSFGKKIGGDILANKKTFLLITAREKASASDKEKLDYWIADEGGSEKINAVKSLYESLGVNEASAREILSYTNKAKEILEEISGDEDAKQILGSYIDLLNHRIS